MDQRASDADRDRVATRLREHYGEGRLSDEDLSARLDRAYAATTVGDLERLTRDLPAPAPLPAPPEERRGRPRSASPRREVTRGGRWLRASLKMHAMVFVLVNALLVAIWALAGQGEFWPVWSMLGWGVGLGCHAAPVVAGVGTRRAGSPDALAERVAQERPSLRRAAAPDGTVTLLFTDIAGSTELNDSLGDLRWLEVLRAHNDVVRAQVDEHGGFEVKAQGDGFMIAFPSAREAVRSALAIQAALGREVAEVRVRAGLHTGEAVREQDDFYGRNVVQAARIAAAAEPGETLVSAVVKELVQSAGDLEFGPPREVELKGLGPATVHPVR